MRLSEQQIDAICSSFSAYMQSHKAKLYLYGSRVNDQLKGGDIDLLLVANDAGTADVLRFFKVNILVQVKSLIGEQKIDITITDIDAAKQDQFIQSILPQAVVLKEWII